METIHSQRQSRLANLRAQKETGSSSNPTAANAASSSSAPVHPFRRAFLSNTTSRLRATARDDLNAATSSSKAAEASAQQIADSSSEGQTLRRYRNWDPTTGQPRTGVWNTISSSGIEEEMKNVQSDVLKDDVIKRNQELDLMNIAPKRVNWDLKRDMVKRLKKLERRDKECRLILIRQRIKAKGGSASAAQAAELAMSTVGRTRGEVGVGEAATGAEDSASEEDSDQE